MFAAVASLGPDALAHGQHTVRAPGGSDGMCSASTSVGKSASRLVLDSFSRGQQLRSASRRKVHAFEFYAGDVRQPAWQFAAAHQKPVDVDVLKAADIPGTSKPASEIPESKFGSTATLDRVDDKSIETVMQELRAIQATGPKLIAMLGTRHLSLMHQQIVEMLAYALVLTDNHIFTSGAGGANAAVIRGALRADRKDLLTVILPQSLSKQPPESQEQLKQVEQMFENKMNDDLPLPEASRLCNEEIISRAQQFICFAFHDSRVLLSAADKARNEGRIVTLLFAD